MTEPRRKVALVTGRSRGIGRAIAFALADSGAAVALTFKEQKGPVLDTVSRIQKHGGSAFAVRADVRNRMSIRSVIAQAEREFGGLDVLVNSAGINKPTAYDQITEEDWDEIMGVNLKGPFICAQEAIPAMKRGGGGSIVNISSVSGEYGGPRIPHYEASKAGLIALGQSLSLVGIPFNIRCNTIIARLVESEMTVAGMQSGAVNQVAEGIPLDRLGTPEEIANAVVFLCSDTSRYITGQTINVNGGLYS